MKFLSFITNTSRQAKSRVYRQTSSAFRRAGFTLIELLVVVAIIIVITGVILANTNKFGGQTLLQNLSYDIALSLREAQVYGLSVRSNNGNFKSGYGMHFDINTPTTYNLFADVAQNGVYQAGEDVAPSPYAIGQNFKLCDTTGGTEFCSGITKLDILFIRPEPDACISYNSAVFVTGGSSYACTSIIQSARIVVTSPRGGFMNVIIYANGQISVQNNLTGA
jgi:prepilin-type N-terminal cleavage/methylation domain-containing protein